MTFEQVPTRMPAMVSTITVILKDKPAAGNDPAIKSAYYEVVILDQFGERLHFPHDTGNLVPHLTQAQIDGLLNFMAALRAKAEAEFLPQE